MRDGDFLLFNDLMKPNRISFPEGKVVISGEQYPIFYNMLNKIFQNRKEHQDFVNWFASRDGILTAAFSISHQYW